jgi:hypothetical protein
MFQNRPRTGHAHNLDGALRRIPRTAVRTVIVLVASLMASAFSGPAQADPYKWCAVAGGTGSMRCYFHTIEQCRASVGGTSFCTQNNFYDGKPVDSAGRPRARTNR